MVTLLFVYGTLMRGEHHHGTLGGAPYRGPARTEPRFRLHLLDYYPTMSPGGSTAVAGELYEVDEKTLALLDELEDVPALYLREPIALEGGGRAEAYVLPAARLPGAAEPIPSGDFRDLPRARRAPR